MMPNDALMIALQNMKQERAVGCPTAAFMLANVSYLRE